MKIVIQDEYFVLNLISLLISAIIINFIINSRFNITTTMLTYLLSIIVVFICRAKRGQMDYHIEFNGRVYSNFNYVDEE